CDPDLLRPPRRLAARADHAPPARPHDRRLLDRPRRLPPLHPVAVHERRLMKRAALSVAALAAALAAAAVDAPGGMGTPGLSAVRICSGAYHDEQGECIRDQR